MGSFSGKTYIRSGDGARRGSPTVPLEGTSNTKAPAGSTSCQRSYHQQAHLRSWADKSRTMVPRVLCVWRLLHRRQGCGVRLFAHQAVSDQVSCLVSSYLGAPVSPASCRSPCVS